MDLFKITVLSKGRTNGDLRPQDEDGDNSKHQLNSFRRSSKNNEFECYLENLARSEQKKGYFGLPLDKNNPYAIIRGDFGLNFEGEKSCAATGLTGRVSVGPSTLGGLIGGVLSVG